MSKTAIALFTLLACGSASAAPAFPALPEASLDLSPFTLLGSVREPVQVRVVLVGDRFAFVGDRAPAEIPRITVYAMPVIVPAGNLDRGIPILTPDPSIDYKIRIKP
jgi:hypothetical protein